MTQKFTLQFLVIIFCCFVVAGSQFINAQTTWTGNVNSDWSNAGNWTAGIPDANDSVTIPDVATNDPEIKAGTNAFAKSIKVEQGGALTIENTGSLTIDDSDNDGILNEGTVDNFGKILIISITSFFPNGIYNKGFFNNLPSGEIEIEEVLYGSGIWNENPNPFIPSGFFTNEGIISIGKEDIGDSGIKNLSWFSNLAGGEIKFGDCDIYSIDNSATFINEGNIKLGEIGYSFSGIYNTNIFKNNVGGNIYINKINLGIENSFGDFTNEGKIESVGSFLSTGIQNEGTFSNKASGEINIIYALTQCIWNHFGHFSNLGIINLGGPGEVMCKGIVNSGGETFFTNDGGQISIENSGVTFSCWPNETKSAILNQDYPSQFNNINGGNISIDIASGAGIINEGIFDNLSNSQISIEETEYAGIKNQGGGIFTNKSKIAIGENKKVGQSGISNENLFYNEIGGEVYIDETGEEGIFNSFMGSFFNKNKIIIGANKKTGGHGINAEGYIKNEPGGEIYIDETGDDGINSEDLFTNNGKIIIGANKKTGGRGIKGFIDNEAGGEIHIDETVSDGIFSTVLTNKGKIFIGANKKTGGHGINGFIDNAAGGEIHIDETEESGIFNVGSFITNKSTIIIGANKKVGKVGIYIGGVGTSFNNEINGEIHIDDTVDEGINNSNSFINEGKINIGQNKKIGSSGIFNEGDFGTFENKAGGEINIDETSSDGIYTDADFVNAGKITLGLNMKIGSTGIHNNALFKNKAGGEINIDETSFNGIDSMDDFVNEGNINIGQNKKTGNTGLSNRDLFVNKPGGEINIDETGGSGIYNEEADFENGGKITLGLNKKIGKNGIFNDDGNFENEAGGEINIEETTLDGIENDGNFTNEGNLSIGMNQKIGGIGIHNQSSFINANEIHIDETLGDGIFNESGTFNAGNLNIGLNKKTGGNGIHNKADFYSGAIINIEETGENGIWNEAGTFEHIDADLFIGKHKKTGKNGILNEATFKNGRSQDQSFGYLQIDETGENGILNESGNFINDYGNLSIGLNKKPLGNGIHNKASFLNETYLDIGKTNLDGILNEAGFFDNLGIIDLGITGKIEGGGILNKATFHNFSLLVIQDIDGNGILNEAGTFLNNDLIIIGSDKLIGANGIYNKAFFVNIPNLPFGVGKIQIEETNENGILNEAGTFQNEGRIDIGENEKTGMNGIRNEAFFNNKFDGYIQIDETGDDGILNEASTFKSDGIIVIGASKKTGGEGVHNKATFNNTSTGYIQVDESATDGILNEGTFENNFSIFIGGTKKTGGAGIYNKSTFNNKAGSEITIEETTESGIFNESGTFNNENSIRIGENKKPLGLGIENFATLNNLACAEIHLLHNFENSGSAINDGFFGLNTNLANIAGNFTNFGVIEDAQGTFPTGGIFVNNEVRIAPTTSNSGAVIQSAFDYSSLTNIDSLSIWLDANYSNWAGTFDENTNTFTPNPALAQGVHDLYVLAYDNRCFSPQKASWKLTILQGACNAPVANCKDIEVILDTKGEASITAQDVDNGSTADCGLQSLEIDMEDFDCSHVGIPQTVTLTITDLNNSTDNCTATVTVTDDEKPNFNGTCPSYPNPIGTDQDECFATINFTQPNPSDNCGIAELKAKIWDSNNNVVKNWTTNPNGVFTLDTYKIKWRAKDPSGNKKTCTEYFTVADLQAPDVLCVANLEVQLVNGAASIPASNFQASSSDNCSTNLTIPPFQTNFDCSDRGITPVSITSTDDAGNVGECITEVEVKGTTLTINDISQNEGTGSGFTFFFFKIERAENDCTLQVDYETTDGDATLADSDYVYKNGTGYFAPGGSFISYAVVRGKKDSNYESDENFWVELSNQTPGVTLIKDKGEAMLLNDDAPPLIGNQNDHNSTAFSSSQKFLGKAKLYPNPVRNGLHISIPELWVEHESVQVDLLDVLGKSLVAFEMIDNQIVVEVSALAAGIYHILFTAKDGKQYSDKFVKVD